MRTKKQAPGKSEIDAKIKRITDILVEEFNGMNCMDVIFMLVSITAGAAKNIAEICGVSREETFDRIIQLLNILKNGK